MTSCLFGKYLPKRNHLFSQLIFFFAHCFHLGMFNQLVVSIFSFKHCSAHIFCCNARLLFGSSPCPPTTSLSLTLGANAIQCIQKSECDVVGGKERKAEGHGHFVPAPLAHWVLVVFESVATFVSLSHCFSVEFPSGQPKLPTQGEITKQLMALQSKERSSKILM